MTFLKKAAYFYKNRAPECLFGILICFAVFSPRAIGTVFPVLCLVAALPHLSHYHFKDYLRLFAPVFAITLLSLASVYWSISPEASLDRVFKTIPLLFVLSFLPIAFGNFYEHRNYIAFFKVTAYALVGAYLFIGLDFYLNGQVYYFLHSETPKEIFNRSNYNRSLVSLFLISLLPLYFLATSKNFKPLAVLGVSMCIIAYFSSSQSLQIGFAVFTLAFLMTRFNLPWLLAFSVILSLFIVFLPWIMPYIFGLEPVFLKNYIGQGYPLQRLEIWKNVSLLVQEKAFLGHGIETLRTDTFEEPLKFLDSDSVLHAHNIYLQIWYEFGALGIILFLVFLWSYLKQTINKGAAIKKHLLFCILSSMIFVSMVSYGLWQAWYLAINCLVLIFAYQFNHTAQQHDFQKS